MSNNPLEHAEHIAHAGHGGGDHGHGHGHDDHAAQSRLGTFIGITMAVLGVILAYCAAEVGDERTELIQTLVEQQNAHAKYQAQQMKHRIAIISLRQVRGEIPADEIGARLDEELAKIDAEQAAPPPAAKAIVPAVAASPAAAPKPAVAEKPEAAAEAVTTRAARTVAHGLIEAMTPRKSQVMALADTVERYEKEGHSAKEWTESFEPAVKAHVLAQQRFDLAQLLAEIGIVVASVALLIKRRAPWLLALALGAASVGLVIHTHVSTGGVVHAAEEKIEETGKEYRAMRNDDATAEADRALVAKIRAWGGVTAAPKPASAHEAPAKEEHHK